RVAESLHLSRLDISLRLRRRPCGESLTHGSSLRRCEIDARRLWRAGIENLKFKISKEIQTEFALFPRFHSDLFTRSTRRLASWTLGLHIGLMVWPGQRQPRIY